MAQPNESASLPRPVIGVLLGTSVAITSGARQLAEANKSANTTLYFFSTKGVSFKRKVIRGTSFNHSKSRWEKGVFPFPDILYVRGGSGTSVLNTIEKFDELGIKRINPIAGFDKSELFHKLSEDSKVQKFLPYTRDLKDISRLRTILKKRNAVYIKACRGRRGMQVMRVVKLASGDYEYSYSILGKLVRDKVSSFRSLGTVVKSFFGDRPRIVQQAIDLLTVEKECLVDCRAELQRTKDGEIEIVAIPIRIGKSRSPITTHGSAYRFEDYLQKLFPKHSKYQIQALEKKVHRFLKDVYQSVEKVYGKFGEMGIDFAVDKQENIWLIECNAQSAKVSVRKSYGEHTVRKIYLNPLEYAKTMILDPSDKDSR